MLPASDLTEILANLAALNLEPSTTAQILAAVLAPLLRSSGPQQPDLPHKRAVCRGRNRGKPRSRKLQPPSSPPIAHASAPPARSPLTVASR